MTNHASEREGFEPNSPMQNAMKVFSQKSSVNSRKVQKLDIGAIPSGIYVLYIKENGVVLDHIYFVIK